MFRQLLDTQLPLALGTMILWALLGALAGAVLGGIVHRVSSRSGAFRTSDPQAKWPRLAALAWLLLSGLALGGLLGGCEGALRGVERVVRESPFRKEALDRAAEIGAAGMVWLDLYLQNSESGKPGDPAEAQAAPLGDRPFDARAFVARLEKVESRIVTEALPKCMEHLRTKVNLPRTGLVASMSEAAMEFSIRRVVRGKATEAFVSRGIPIDDFFATLPDRLTQRQLSDHVAEKALVPLFVSPARAWVRGHQAVFGALLALAFTAPLVVFRALRRSGVRPSETA